MQEAHPKKNGDYIFEEFYYIIKGSGVIQWEGIDGKMKEVKVSAGDIIFFPRDVAKHQLLNNGKDKIYLIFGGSPLTESNVKSLDR